MSTCWQLLCLQVIGKPQREGDDGKCRVRPAGGWKERAACNIKIVDAMYTAISVGDTGFGVVAHARGAHVMVATKGVGADERIGLPLTRTIGEPGSRNSLPHTKTL